MTEGQALRISKLESVGALVLAVVVAAIGGAAITYSLGTPPTPRLLQGLDGEWATANADFKRRLAAHFPVGTPEAKLIKELSDQGFKPKLWRPRADEEMNAVLDLSSIPCNVGARIQWRTDAAGRITGIGGRYGEEGCW